MIPTAILRQILTVESYLGESASGPLYDEENAVRYPARVRPRRRVVRSSEDTVTMWDAVADLRPNATVSVGDRATCDGVVYRVEAVDQQMDLGRVHHLSVQLSRSTT